MGASVLPLLIWTLALLAPARAPQAAAEPHTFLRRHLRFSEAELRTLDRGGVVSRTLAPTDKREVMAFAAVRVRVDRPAYVSGLRNIVSFKKSPMVVAIGRFGTTPDAADLSSLTLERAPNGVFAPRRLAGMTTSSSVESIPRFGYNLPASVVPVRLARHVRAQV